MPRFSKSVAISLAFSSALTADAVAQTVRPDPNPPAEQRMIPFTGAVPACDDPTVLAQILDQFDAREREYWTSGLTLDAFYEVAETGLRNNGPSFIPRRYCKAQAAFNDGVMRKVTYTVGEQLGFIGIGPGVTWCVVGLDRNRAFAPHCRAAGP